MLDVISFFFLLYKIIVYFIISEIKILKNAMCLPWKRRILENCLIVNILLKAPTKRFWDFIMVCKFVFAFILSFCQLQKGLKILPRAIIIASLSFLDDGSPSWTFKNLTFCFWYDNHPPSYNLTDKEVNPKRAVYLQEINVSEMQQIVATVRDSFHVCADWLSCGVSRRW